MTRPLLLAALALGTAAATAPVAAQPSPQPGADRYGPRPADAPAAAPGGRAASPVPATWRGRVLSWPGKVEVLAPLAPATARPVAMPTVVMVQRRAPAIARPARHAATKAAARAPAAPAPVSLPDPAPTPMHSPAVAAQDAAPPPVLSGAPSPAAAADPRYGYDATQNHGVRIYSVSRQFGLAPDPAPIPPQFFTATADLGADPPGPLPVNHTTPAARAALVGGGDSTTSGQ